MAGEIITLVPEAAYSQFFMLTIAAVGFVLQTIGLAVTGVWKLTRVETGIRDALSKHQKTVDDEFTKIRDEIATEALRVERVTGETAAAIRQKVHDVELWGRDNYIMTKAFDNTVKSVLDAVKDMDTKIDRRLNRIEGSLLTNNAE